jgi:hypothetical protein
MQRALLCLAAIALVGCDVFKSTAPRIEPCKQLAVITTTHFGRVDTVGVVWEKTFYCKIPHE